MLEIIIYFLFALLNGGVDNNIIYMVFSIIVYDDDFDGTYT